MNIYLSPRGKISMADLFDGRLEKHGVHEAIVHSKPGVDGTDERHRYLMSHHGSLCVCAYGDSVQFWYKASPTNDAGPILDAITGEFGIEILDDNDWDPNSADDIDPETGMPREQNEAVPIASDVGEPR
jgi:hypothetical protein